MLYHFSQAVVRELLDKESLAETMKAVNEWCELYPDDRDRAAIEFAMQLATDFKSMYCPRPCRGFVESFMKLGLKRVNWRTVAEYLLDRFAPTHEQRQLELVTEDWQRVPSRN
jgi:hypothetical protein